MKTAEKGGGEKLRESRKDNLQMIFVADFVRLP